MLDTMHIRPYREGEALKVNDFLHAAKLIHGDADLSPVGHHSIYLATTTGEEIVALIEVRVCGLSRVQGNQPGLFITKIALDPRFGNDEMVLLCLNHLLREATRMEVPFLFIDGDEIPYERESGFRLAATLGIYDAEDPEGNIGKLRAKRIDGSIDLYPGFLHLL